MIELCALEGIVAGAHGPPHHGSEHGMICADCDAARRARGLEGPDTEPVKAGVWNEHAFAARTSEDAPLHGAASWEWLPYTAAGKKLDNPVHVRGAAYRSAPKGSLPPQHRLLDLESLAARLTSEQREPLLLQVLHGLSYAAIASQLGVAVGTVRERLRRAREALRALQVP